ncbi:chromophore lyase CpcT/CpeT [filamentous cyanobacterium LEGE 11480]|uniref:Chromophore lyase CpcT/CpeT n=1 Tax=Romeriopsis navalis LEGE 11480 TaxID=2777977 RepID=A0A928VQ01_9CYAN|nr:chromophore lyase CpcT/CpeT [Romeriopsis navalis]MBE9030490.1 chromophore lyase CpcT/CpeT [Romeriopsis navalis LEGE 11480]
MSQLQILAQFLSGVYDNREQALAEPIWYVHLRCWIRPTPCFRDDSITLFVEQANILNPEQPYRQRLMRLRETKGQLTAQFYSFQTPSSVLGYGQDPSKLAEILNAPIDELPGCQLNITQIADDRFSAMPPADCICQFTFPGKDGQLQTGQVELGFEVSPTEFHSYDKGINPTTQKPIWGALMGPYRYTKRQVYSLLD